MSSTGSAPEVESAVPDLLLAGTIVLGAVAVLLIVLDQLSGPGRG
jgi:hypothetical protein